MAIDLYIAFVLASVVLVLIPGPNVAVIVAASIGQGSRHGLVAVAGTSTAMVFQLALTVLGMTAMLALLADWFAWLRWAGVAYLVYLGIRQWRAASDGPSDNAAPGLAKRLFWRGFIVSATNPKTLLFYGAFFPQFIDPAGDIAAQLAVLAVTFLVVAIILDSGWALTAGYAKRHLAGRGRLVNRLSGGFLIGAGLSLALARRS
jgi:threonine/homoserine/homoserine lactone efflux protein